MLLWTEQDVRALVAEAYARHLLGLEMRRRLDRIGYGWGLQVTDPNTYVACGVTSP